MAKNIMYTDIPFEIVKDEHDHLKATTKCPFGFPNKENPNGVGSWYCRDKCPYSVAWFLKTNVLRCTHPLDE